MGLKPRSLSFIFHMDPVSDLTVGKVFNGLCVVLVCASSVNFHKMNYIDKKKKKLVEVQNKISSHWKLLFSANILVPKNVSHKYVP